MQDFTDWYLMIVRVLTIIPIIIFFFIQHKHRKENGLRKCMRRMIMLFSFGIISVLAMQIYLRILNVLELHTEHTNLWFIGSATILFVVTYLAVWNYNKIMKK